MAKQEYYQIEFIRTNCIYRRGLRLYGVLDNLTSEDLTEWVWNGPYPKEELEDILDDALIHTDLTETQRDVIMFRFFEGLLYREIGERLGMSRQAAHMHKIRGCAKLRIYLEERMNE